MTCTGAQPVCVYHYADSRGQRVPIELLTSENRKHRRYGRRLRVVSKSLRRIQYYPFGLLGTRQKKGKTAKVESGKADQALAYTQKLYDIEKKIEDEP